MRKPFLVCGMNLREEIQRTGGFKNLELLAKQVVEGFISGMHKSPFHGFSAEFAEHKIYNSGESTKHIDWKLFAKTDRLYTKRYDEETNLRCHFIIDNSSSMHYPKLKTQSLMHVNKIGFSSLACACLMHLLKRQRDAVGMSVFSNDYEFYANEKSSERHHQMLLNQLDEMLTHQKEKKNTSPQKYLHQIAEQLKRRSLVFLFTDMFQTDTDEEELFEALRHLKYNKHEVVLFHVVDKTKEELFDFDNGPKRFVDVETGEAINVYADQIRDGYKNAVRTYFKHIKLKCFQYQIKYVEADINKGFETVMSNFMVERQKFI